MEIPRFDQMVERTARWFSGLKPKVRENFTLALQQLTSEKDFISGWQEVLARLRSFDRFQITNFFQEQFKLSGLAAKGLSLLVHSSGQEQTVLSSEQIRALEQVSGEIASQVGVDPQELKTTVLTAASAGSGRSSSFKPSWLDGEPAGVPGPGGGQKKDRKDRQRKSVGTVAPRGEEGKKGYIARIAGLAAVGLLAALILKECVAGPLIGTIAQKTEKTEELPPAFVEFLKDPEIRATIDRANQMGIGKELRIGTASGETALKIEVLGTYQQTQAYLEGGTTDNWLNLVADLNNLPETGLLSDQQTLNVLGQYLALKKANCLLPNKHIDKARCEGGNPGFKNLNREVKDEYIERYNRAIERLPKSLSMADRGKQAAFTKKVRKEQRSAFRPKI